MGNGREEGLPQPPGRGKGQVLAMLTAKPQLRVAPVPHRAAAARLCPVQPAAMRGVGLRKGDRTMSKAATTTQPTRIYRLTRHKDGFRVEEGAAPLRLIALIERRLDRKGGPVGWRFRPATIMRGPQSKIWHSPEAALVGFGLMTKARARDAVAAAMTAVSGLNGEAP